MKKGYRTILTVCMLLIAYTAVGQQPDKDMDSFPSTEEALSQIGRASCRERVKISVVAVSLKKEIGNI